MVEELSLLYQVSRSMLTTVKLDQLLRIILTSVTLKNQRGFDRATLFLVNDQENVIETMLSIGPRSEAEAEIWRQEYEQSRGFPAEGISPPEMEKAPYGIQPLRMRIPLSEKRSILIKAIREKRAFNIQDAASDPEVNPDILSVSGAAPLRSFP